MRTGAVLAGMLLSLLVPAAPGVADGPPPWAVSDPQGDQVTRVVSFTGPTDVPVAPTPVAAFGDLRGIAIDGENELGFRLSLFVQSLQVSSSPFGNQGWLAFYVTFDLAQPLTHYGLDIRVYGVMDDTSSPAQYYATSADGTLCLIDPSLYNGSSDSACQGYGGGEPIRITFDAAASAVRAWIPKASLLGLDPRASNGPMGYPSASKATYPAALRRGDVLTHVHALAVADSLYLATVRDEAPDKGSLAPPYVLQAPTANLAVALKLPGSEGTLPVVRGGNETVSFTLRNNADSRRLLALEYGLDVGTGGRGAYAVGGPRSVSLPANATRNFTLFLAVPADATPDARVTLTVRGLSAGFPDEVAEAVAVLDPEVAITPDQNRLFLHALPTPSTFPTGCDAVPFDQSACMHPILSTSETEPDAAQPDSIGVALSPSYLGDPGSVVGSLYDVAMQHPTPLPVVFDRARPIEVRLRITTASDLDGLGIDASLSYGPPGGYLPTATVAEGKTTAHVTASGTDVVLTAPVMLGADAAVPAGSVFHLRIEFHAPATALPAAPEGLHIAGGASFLTLPLVALPQEAAPSGPSPFQLSVIGNKDEFVNPGKARLFHLSLLDQDTREHRAHAAVAVQPSTWRAEVLPGADYGLRAGDTLTLGVLLHAASEAREGEAGRVYLNVTDESGRMSPVVLRAVATTGVDLPDDAAAYHPDPDAAGRLLQAKHHRTPGFEAVLLLAAAAAAASRRR